MDFYIKRGQKYRIRISDKESDAVKLRLPIWKRIWKRFWEEDYRAMSTHRKPFRKWTPRKIIPEIRIGTIGMCEGH